jgi:undecaprenyl diphosphate synthase
MAGHQAGFNRIRPTVKAALSYNIPYLTVYSFSSENWNRPEEEVQGILNILVDNIDREAVELHKEGVRMRHIGRLDELPETIRDAIERACRLTGNNTRMVFSFAFNYGGRIELIDAARQLVREKVPPEEIDEQSLDSRLYTAGIPDVELLIRTGGELRISNFLLWQAAYAEFYFTRVLWPDFTPAELKRALTAYSNRQRRFGSI